MSLFEKLAEIQQKLKAPKNQVNEFGGYKYRSCEDILEAVKPLLGDVVLTISDEMIDVGGRVYVKATATIVLGDEKLFCSACAREAEKPKAKTDDSQLTGATSSYARKYALNGLFLIDDTKDADATNTHDYEQAFGDYDAEIEVLRGCKDKAQLRHVWESLTGKQRESQTLISIKDEMKEKLSD